MILILDCTDLYQNFHRTHPETPAFSPLFSCEVIFSSRKTLAVQIEKDMRITVRAPYRTPQGAITTFLFEHRQWIFSHYVKQLLRRENAVRSSILPDVLRSGDTLRFYDRQFLLQVNQIPRCNRVSIYFKSNMLIIDTPEPSSELLRDCVARWYKKNGKYIFEKRVSYYAKQMRVTYKNITLKEQKTRWGSCSSLGNLNFNWKLLLMEPHLLDYVVVHELAHRLEMNHSAAFWKIVAVYIPDYKECRKALKAVNA